jgi:hypothetical protein
MKKPESKAKKLDRPTAVHSGAWLGCLADKCKEAVAETIGENEDEILKELRVSFRWPDEIEMYLWNTSGTRKLSDVLKETVEWMDSDLSPEEIKGWETLAKDLEKCAAKIRAIIKRKHPNDES